MSTGPLIGIPAREIIAQQTSAGIGNTHGSMDKALYLQIVRNFWPDSFYLFQRKLPSTYHPFCSLFFPEQIGAIIGIIGLCGNMNFYLGTNFPCQHKHTRIRNNQGIRLYLPKLFKIRLCLFQILIMFQNISRYIYPHMTIMGKSNPFCHLLNRKVFGLRPKSKSFSSDIYCIRAKNNGCF